MGSKKKPYVPLKKEKYDWDDIPLGKMTDQAISDRYDIPISTIQNARRRRKISARNSNAARLSNAQWLELPLGKVSDRDIAREHGLNYSTVTGARRRLKIPAYVPAGRTRRRPAIRGIDWDQEPRLGTMPDGELARILRLHSSSSVSRARSMRRIPVYKLDDAIVLDRKLRNLQLKHDELEAKWNSREQVAARLRELSK